MKTTLARARLSLLVLCLAPGCTLLPPVDFERMIYQNRFGTWEACPYFEDGRAMRTPPEGTVPRERETGDPARISGTLAGAYAARVPVPVTPALLAAGRARFETYCAACHGVRGDGVSRVAANMTLRRPPSIAGPAARALPPGRIYQVISEGYGLMRSYSEDLTSPEERWAVVAYLEALGLSQEIPLASLPPDLRREAEEALR